MLRRVSTFAAAAAAFGLAPIVTRLDAVSGSASLLALGALLGLAASGAPLMLAAAGGAAGAFASSLVSASSPALGGAALVAFAMTERTSRVRGRKARLAHVAASIAVGAVAGSIADAYAGSPASVRVVATIVCAVLVGLPLFIDADDPLACALDAAAEAVGEPARKALHDGAELRRSAEASLLDRDTAREVRRTWSSLRRLAEARVRLERGAAEARAASSPGGAVRAAVDRRIAEHVAALTRAFAAVDAASAAVVGLDDTAVRSVATTGESLEQVSRAMVEDV